MFLIPTLVGGFILAYIVYAIDKKLLKEVVIIYGITGVILSSLVYGISINSKVIDKEIWSGKIVSVEHNEEWDEEITETYTDSKGKSHTRTYTKHHSAENYIKTSDGGSILVNRSLDNKIEFNDKFPNSKQELEKFYPIGTATSSVHYYKNKVAASYSIYKHKEIDLRQYKNLPKYPIKDKTYIQVEDRFIGSIDNKENVINKLNEVNSDLNSKEKKKQVNLVFVNLGDVGEDYGFALQDYWEGGNKNDVIVSFAVDSTEKIKWVYPFSWADNESSEKLKIDVRNYLMENNELSNFESKIENIGTMIEKDFVRKQFADFNYINVELPVTSYVVIVVLNIGLGVAVIIMTKKNRVNKIKFRW